LKSKNISFIEKAPNKNREYISNYESTIWLSLSIRVSKLEDVQGESIFHTQKKSYKADCPTT